MSESISVRFEWLYCSFCAASSPRSSFSFESQQSLSIAASSGYQSPTRSSAQSLYGYRDASTSLLLALCVLKIFNPLSLVLFDQVIDVDRLCKLQHVEDLLVLLVLRLLGRVLTATRTYFVGAAKFLLLLVGSLLSLTFALLVQFG